MCTDGVPMPSAKFGNVEIAGAYTPRFVAAPFDAARRALIVVFCAARVDLGPRYVTV